MECEKDEQTTITLSGFNPTYEQTIYLPERGYNSELTYFLEADYESIHMHVYKPANSDRIEKRTQAIKERLIQAGYTETLQGDSTISFHDATHYNFPFNKQKQKQKIGFKQSLIRMIERF